MRCIRCGTEMTSNIGGNYYCPHCGFAVNDLLYRPQNCDIPMPIGFEKQGWICSKCGASISPDSSFCPFCAPKQSNTNVANIDLAGAPLDRIKFGSTSINRGGTE